MKTYRSTWRQTRASYVVSVVRSITFRNAPIFFFFLRYIFNRTVEGKRRTNRRLGDAAREIRLRKNHGLGNGDWVVVILLIHKSRVTRMHTLASSFSIRFENQFLDPRVIAEARPGSISEYRSKEFDAIMW